MMKVIHGIVEEDGNIRLLETPGLAAGQRVIVAVIDDGGACELADLEGCVPYSGPPVSIDAMNAAIASGRAGA